MRLDKGVDGRTTANGRTHRGCHAPWGGGRRRWQEGADPSSRQPVLDALSSRWPHLATPRLEKGSTVPPMGGCHCWCEGMLQPLCAVRRPPPLGGCHHRHHEEADPSSRRLDLDTRSSRWPSRGWRRGPPYLSRVEEATVDGMAPPWCLHEGERGDGRGGGQRAEGGGRRCRGHHCRREREREMRGMRRR